MKQILSISSLGILMILFLSSKKNTTTIIKQEGVLEQNIIIGDNETHELKINFYGQNNINTCIYGFERKDLPTTPIIIKSFEANPYDCEVLKSYCFKQIGDPSIIKYEDDLFEGPIKFYYYNRKDIISTVSPPPFSNNTFDSYYYGSHKGEQIEFFHILMKSKLAREAMSEYSVKIFRQLQDNLPISIKYDIRDIIKRIQSFLKKYPNIKTELAHYEKEGVLLNHLSTWEAFTYRRLISDKVPILEISNFLNKLTDEIDYGNSKYINLLKYTINDDLIIRDTTGRKCVVHSKHSLNKIVLPLSDVRIKCYKENQKFFYQFEEKIDYNKYKFLGLYSSSLDAVRSN